MPPVSARTRKKRNRPTENSGPKKKKSKHVETITVFSDSEDDHRPERETIVISDDDEPMSTEREKMRQLPHFATVEALEKANDLQLQMLDGVSVSAILDELDKGRMNPYLVYRWVSDSEAEKVYRTKTAQYKEPENDVLRAPRIDEAVMYTWSTVDRQGFKYGKESKDLSLNRIWWCGVKFLLNKHCYTHNDWPGTY